MNCKRLFVYSEHIEQQDSSSNQRVNAMTIAIIAAVVFVVSFGAYIRIAIKREAGDLDYKKTY